MTHLRQRMQEDLRLRNFSARTIRYYTHTGISASDISRILEPFFTTKEENVTRLASGWRAELLIVLVA